MSTVSFNILMFTALEVTLVPNKEMVKKAVVTFCESHEDKMFHGAVIFG